uniref:uncharacterized protein LOC124049925 isoform X2 n=1 Tax=Scatophagus argus TaxID=75038 RepID=UPI001ED7F4E8|nr:uncharacterized protein LOC124049925 isoform X2 [Scatophagus argus]
MLFCFILLTVSLVTCLHGSGASACGANCTDKPVFTPSKLVVKYGDSASARCSVCQHACQASRFGLEIPVGVTIRNETTISWTVDRLTEWDTTLICYYDDDTTRGQCCSILLVTVYYPPDNVSISLAGHTGPMFEDHQYTLQCEVQHVAPVGHLTVTFYRGQTPLAQLQSNNTQERTPVSETFTVNITASKEDDGGQYWCEAKLDLGPEGPQPPPVVKSQNSLRLHYAKYAHGLLHENCADKPVFTPSKLVVKYGDSASARCSVCQHACQTSRFGLEIPVGVRTRNETTKSISWTVDRLTEWGITPFCYYNDDATGDQCGSFLPVIVYHPPDKVSISLAGHTESMYEDHQYTLQCEVQHVAPVGHLTVTFYRGQTPLAQLQSKNTQEKKPVNVTFTVNITPSKEDDGGHYWCEAKLDLGPEGPQPPPVVKSQNSLTSIVYSSTISTGPSLFLVLAVAVGVVIVGLIISCFFWCFWFRLRSVV